MSKKNKRQRPAVITIKGENYHTSDSAAGFLGFSPATLNTWRHYGRGPRWIRFSGREVRYPERDLLEYVRSRPYGDGAPASALISVSP